MVASLGEISSTLIFNKLLCFKRGQVDIPSCEGGIQHQSLDANMFFDTDRNPML